MRKLLILQAMGCILFAIIIIILHILNIFSPISVIILYFIMGIANIINARIMLIKPIEEISTHDELTGCYNRVKLDSKIGEYENYKTYAIIFFDLNNLKAANDTHGHDYGDTILIRASNQLRYWHTYGDLYRIGGDEFIVVVPNAIKSRLEKILNKWYDTLSILNTETLPEFKGQVIDILEDYFEEHHVNIPCTDKDDAIKDGEDPSGLAIIYGEDYDKIGDEIEYYINLKKSDDKPVKFEPSEMRAISGKLVDIAAGLLEKITDNAVRTASISNMNKDKKELRHKIADTFAEWRLYGQTYYVSHRVDGRYHTEVVACSIEDAIKKSDYNFQEADFGELECIDSYANAVEDETGNIVWDRA